MGSNPIDGDHAPEMRNTRLSETTNTIDGGLVGWLQVLGCWCLFIGTWGIVTSYGSFQTYYETTLFPHLPPSTIAWIGSTQGFIMMAGGLFVGPILDAGHLRLLLISGSCFISLGMLLVSFSSQYWHAFLAHGVMVGIGGTLINVPSSALIPMYFMKRRALAQGIVATGSSFGGLLIPLLYRFLGGIGFSWTTRIVTLIIVIGQAVAIVVLKLPPKRALPYAVPNSTDGTTVVVTEPDAPTPTIHDRLKGLIDTTAFKSTPFLVHSGSVFLGFMGIYVPFTYIGSYALESGTIDKDLTFYLLPIMNATSTFGRIVPNILADYFGSFNTMTLCSLISSVLVLWLTVGTPLGANTQNSLIAFCALYGFFTAPFVSLIPVSYAMLTPSREVLGRRFGLAFTIMGIGFLIGTPIAGAILQTGGWTGLYAYSFTLVLGCAVLVWIVSVHTFGWAFWRQRGVRNSLAD